MERDDLTEYETRIQSLQDKIDTLTQQLALLREMYELLLLKPKPLTKGDRS